MGLDVVAKHTFEDKLNEYAGECLVYGARYPSKKRSAVINYVRRLEKELKELRQAARLMERDSIDGRRS